MDGSSLEATALWWQHVNQILARPSWDLTVLPLRVQQQYECEVDGYKGMAIGRGREYEKASTREGATMDRGIGYNNRRKERVQQSAEGEGTTRRNEQHTTTWDEDDEEQGRMDKYEGNGQTTIQCVHSRKEGRAFKRLRVRGSCRGGRNNKNGNME